MEKVGSGGPIEPTFSMINAAVGAADRPRTRRQTPPVP